LRREPRAHDHRVVPADRARERDVTNLLRRQELPLPRGDRLAGRSGSSMPTNGLGDNLASRRPRCRLRGGAWSGRPRPAPAS
jgi:hypothetical protein